MSASTARGTAAGGYVKAILGDAGNHAVVDDETILSQQQTVARAA